MHPKPASGILLLFALSLSSSGIAAPQEEREEGEEINYEMVRCNPILRHALGVNSPYAESTNQQSIESKFRENWVDAQVDYFVKQTYTKLGDLKVSVQRASSASSELITEDSSQRAQAIATLRQALLKTEDQSRGLRTSLAMVLTDLDMKDKFNVKVSPEAEAAGFKAEIESLSEQISNAERVIRDYFFKPTHVTSLADLRSANMLDYLKRVERIARAIREKL